MNTARENVITNTWPKRISRRRDVHHDVDGRFGDDHKIVPRATCRSLAERRTPIVGVVRFLSIGRLDLREVSR